jgi:hypothetical protein
MSANTNYLGRLQHTTNISTLINVINLVWAFASYPTATAMHGPLTTHIPELAEFIPLLESR